MRYFFDTAIDGSLCLDHQGLELSDLATAQLEARKGLVGILRDEAVHLSARQYEMQVRDHNGPVYALTFNVSDGSAKERTL